MTGTSLRRVWRWMAPAILAFLSKAIPVEAEVRGMIVPTGGDENAYHENQWAICVDLKMVNFLLASSRAIPSIPAL